MAIKTVESSLEQTNSREMYYIDSEGRICDEDIWAEILGADDEDLTDLNELGLILGI